ncbi:DUF6303 family protein [Streptomyces sp. ATexAB-D23]|uniref:DUF6303 family protein n=1 Tax=unclassified Streptomyces TaxID=2593676 RepID=UPI000362F320|nr:DUF6303 family protein [Streptomyces sp. ATexAB-D23]MYY05031.1 hypothetical protein [Streptomyces sp. SID4913]
MSAPDTFPAQMAIAQSTGRWRLYVAIYGGLVSEWPEYVFEGAAVPSVQDRSRALDALGYTFTGAPVWDWIEDYAPGDDPAQPVSLIATTRVREVAS